jgi:hypothetical protein
MEEKMSEPRKTRKPREPRKPLPPTYPEWVQRKRKIPIEDAAAILSVHPDTFEAHYPHLIEDIGPRLKRVELGHVLDLKQSKT